MSQPALAEPCAATASSRAATPKLPPSPGHGTRAPLPLPPLSAAALDRAFRHYKEQPQDWQQLRQRIMSDAGRWSWDTAAGSYVQLYQQVTMQ